MGGGVRDREREREHTARVEEVLDEAPVRIVLVDGLVGEPPALRAPLRHLGREASGLGAPRGVPRPDPDHALALGGRVGGDSDALRDFVGGERRDADALSVLTELPSVISTLDGAVLPRAYGERGGAVGAAVLQADDLARVAPAEDDQGLAEELGSERAGGRKVAREAHGVPIVQHVDVGGPLGIVGRRTRGRRGRREGRICRRRRRRSVVDGELRRGVDERICLGHHSFFKTVVGVRLEGGGIS